MRKPFASSNAVLTGVMGVVLTILYLPIAVPVLSSFFVVQHGAIDWSAPTLSAYSALFRNASVLDALVTTLMVGCAATVLSVTLGTALALYSTSKKAKGKQALEFIIYLPFLMPPIISGLALLIFFREVEVQRSLLTVVIGHTVFVLALVYRLIVNRKLSLSPSLAEASYDLGATTWQTFRLVILPNLAGAIAGAAILAFALSFDETMITLLLTGTQTTLPVRLWAMMRLGFTPDINALVTLVFTFTIVICLGALRFVLPQTPAAAADPH